MIIKIATNKEEKNQVIQVRKSVFVNEQHVPPDIEIDEFESVSTHFIGYSNENPVAASRLRFVGAYGKLERICVLSPHRGQSYGKMMIDYMENEIKRTGFSKAKLNAQTHARKFYEALGYHAISEEFMDAGIPHITMIKDL